MERSCGAGRRTQIKKPTNPEDAFVVEYSVGNDVIFAFRGHVIGGTTDMAVAAVVAVAFGAVVIGCFLRLRTEVRMWREQSIGVR